MQSFLQTSFGYIASSVQKRFLWLTCCKYYGLIYSMQTAFFVSVLFSFLSLSLVAQPAIQWDKTIGGNGKDNFSSFQQTSDGGYILAGTSNSNTGGDKSQNSRGNYDYWIVKLAANGTKQWDKTFGSTGTDYLKVIRQAPDGSYYLAGESYGDASGDKSQGKVGLSDIWIIKLDANGNLNWEKTIQMAESENVSAMELTPDGGMAIACSYSPAEEQFENYFQGRFIKLSSTGEVQWSKNLPGGIMTLTCLDLTSDGGYIIGADNSGFEATYGKFIIIKMSSDGTMQWTKKIGGDGYSALRNIKQTLEGGYILSGFSDSPAGGDKTESSDDSYQTDYWVVKITSNGTKLWDKTIHAIGYERQSGLILTNDGGCIVSGYTQAIKSLDKSEPSQGIDFWLVKLSANGAIVWDKTIGGIYEDRAVDLITTKDGGMAVAGTSDSALSGNKSEDSRGDYDFWMVKFAPEHSPLPQTPIRINAGGPAFTTATKKLFIADQYYAGIDRTSSIASGDILNTSNDVLYRSGRCSPSFSYNIPVSNGTVDVILHFAETYFGAPGKKGGKGSRQFHVNMEGSRKLTNFDIYASAGGAMRAYQTTIPVAVTDGMLNIDFLTGAADLPRISAIEVIATSSTLNPLADAYVRDGSYNATNYGTVTNLDVKNNISDASARRSSYLRFQLPASAAVSSAKLRIYGHNHENTNSISMHAYGVDNDSWSENGIVKTNAPAASTPSLGYVAVNNAYKYYEIDVTSYVKAQQQSGETLVSLLLADPNNRNVRLVFNSKENSANPPQLIVQISPVVNNNTRLSNEEISRSLEAEPESSSVYPNPVGKQFTVQVSSKHSEDITLDLLNNAGQSYPVLTARKAIAGQKAEVDISNLVLRKGIYLLKVQSSNTSEVLKVLVTE